MFKLHEKLKSGLIELAELKFCKAFLLPDSDLPWLVLVPMKNDTRELHHLEWEEQRLVLEDINKVSKILEMEFSPFKLNIGALGNMVPQLHIHIICRYENDKAWPGPAWGTAPGKDEEILKDYKNKILSHL